MRLGEAAILVDLRDPQGFGAALDEMAESPLKYERASQAAMTHFRNEFSWAHEAKKLLAAIAPHFHSPHVNGGSPRVAHVCG